jgi:transcription elongation factor GreA
MICWRLGEVVFFQSFRFLSSLEQVAAGYRPRGTHQWWAATGQGEVNVMPTPTTREGYDKMKQDLEWMETVEMPRIAKLIAEARAEGDLRENAEYHGQRENQAMLQAKINLLKSKINDAYIVERDTTKSDEVSFGATVTLYDIDAEIEEKYQFVGPGEEDYRGEIMKILVTSPLALQLMNRKIGEVIDVETPGGRIKYEIKAID